MPIDGVRSPQARVEPPGSASANATGDGLGVHGGQLENAVEFPKSASNLRCTERLSTRSVNTMPSSRLRSSAPARRAEQRSVSAGRPALVATARASRVPCRCPARAEGSRLSGYRVHHFARLRARTLHWRRGSRQRTGRPTAPLPPTRLSVAGSAGERNGGGRAALGCSGARGRSSSPRACRRAPWCWRFGAQRGSETRPAALRPAQSRPDRRPREVVACGHAHE